MKGYLFQHCWLSLRRHRWSEWNLYAYWQVPSWVPEKFKNTVSIRYCEQCGRHEASLTRRKS